MSWRSLALKNSLYHTRQYLGAFLANTVAVAVFCMFTAFVQNPAVQHGTIPGPARELLVVCQVVVALFALFFVFYFHTALVRTRNKELGLLLTLGMTPGQIGRMLWREGLLLGAGALATGLALGIGCLRLLLPLLGAALSLPNALAYVLPASVIWATVIYFGLLFFADAAIVAWKVGRRTPRMLLLGARQRQTPPRASLVGVLGALLCLALAYDLAVQYSTMVLLTMIPIVTLSAIGTYLLFSQSLALLFRMLRRRVSGGTSLLVVTRLAYRIHDYARMLTVVTLLSASVLTGMGAVFSLLRINEVNAIDIDPFAVQLVTNAAQPGNLTGDTVSRELAARHLSVRSAVATDLVAGQMPGPHGPLGVAILPESAYLHLRTAVLTTHPELAPEYHPLPPVTAGTAHLLVPYPFSSRSLVSTDPTPVRIGNESVPFRIDQSDQRVLNESMSDLPEFVLVVAGPDYVQLSAAASAADHWHVNAFGMSDWHQSAAAVSQLAAMLPADEQGRLTATITSYTESEQFLSVMLFSGVFISLLFFLAAGCTIYFKLFTQQDDDRRQFAALHRIGLRRREAGQVLTVECILLFFTPVAVATIHSGVAILDLTHLVSHLATTGEMHEPIQLPFADAIWSAFGIVVLLYIACFGAYCAVARLNYGRGVRLARR